MRVLHCNESTPLCHTGVEFLEAKNVKDSAPLTITRPAHLKYWLQRDRAPYTMVNVSMEINKVILLIYVFLHIIILPLQLDFAGP